MAQEHGVVAPLSNAEPDVRITSLALNFANEAERPFLYLRSLDQCQPTFILHLSRFKSALLAWWLLRQPSASLRYLFSPIISAILCLAFREASEASE